jgi:predicted amidohydrolase
MHWTIEANMASILAAVELACRRGATICTFPELAVTGFHRNIASLAKPELVVPEVRKLQAICARRSIAVAVGAPTFSDEGPLNSHLFINAEGDLISTVSKIGLTAPEATFFRRGADRPVSSLHGVRVSAVICREIEDEAAVCSQLAADDVDVLFWPGQMRPDPEQPIADPPAYVQQAQRLARILRTHVIQANWPNSLNRPEESAHTGHSAVIAPTGELLFRLPRQAAGVAVFSLGDSGYEWHASDA